MDEILSFNRLIGRMLIPVIFWGGVVLMVGLGVQWLFQGSIGEGLVMIFLVPLIWRVGCEVVLVLFKVYDQIKALRATLIQLTQPPAAPPEVEEYEEVQLRR